jgi:hypothetical protein
MKVKINDMVRDENKKEFKITYVDRKGYFLESSDGKVKKYESAKSFREKFTFSSRKPMDKIGILIRESDWVEDPSGKLSQVIEIDNEGGVVTGLGQTFESTQLSVCKQIDRERLIESGYREVCTGSDKIKMMDYNSINEAVVYHTGFRKGTTKVLFLRTPLKSTFYERNDPRCWKDISEDYVYVGSIDESDFDLIKIMFREDVMSPNGEATELFESLGFNRCDIRNGDMLIIEGRMFVVTKYGFRTVSESNISKFDLSRSLQESHTQDDYQLAKDVKVPTIVPGDVVKYGERDTANNMKWLGSGKVVKVDDCDVTIEDEAGVKSVYHCNDVFPISYVNN